MKKYIPLLSLLVLSVSISGFVAQNSDELSADQLTRKMFERTKEIKTLTFKMKKIERFEGKMITQISISKLQRNPFKVYSKQEEPSEGLEVLYPSEDGSKEAIINPNGFPWFNVKLDPMGSTMRKNQHHTIYDTGYDLFVSILEHLFDKYGEETEQMAQYGEDVEWDGHKCKTVRFTNQYFKLEDYTVQEGEDILDIAKRMHLGEYMILELNNDVDDYQDVKAGQTIRIPSDYSPKMELCIDVERKIPLVIKVYDSEGLFEHYEYTNVVIDPEIDPQEFQQDYEDYGF